MTVAEVIEKLNLTMVAETGNKDVMVTGGYVSDLLSHVMGQAKPGQIWITMQAHQNIIAVSSLLGLSAVVITGGIEPDGQTIVKAIDQEVILCKTPLTTYEVAGQLHQLISNER